MLAIFLGTYFIVSNLALKRLATTLVEREHRIHGREEKAAELKAELGTIQSSLDAHMRKARLEASDVFVQLKNKAANEQRSILGSARDTATIELKNVRKNLAEKTAIEMKKLEDEVPKIAQQIVEQLLNGPSASRGASQKTLTTGA
jgi:F0F1-type ATP synthase membrane subunit b/b'